jgi:hypothetical protein
MNKKTANSNQIKAERFKWNQKLVGKIVKQDNIIDGSSNGLQMKMIFFFKNIYNLGQNGLNLFNFYLPSTYFFMKK